MSLAGAALHCIWHINCDLERFSCISISGSCVELDSEGSMLVWAHCKVVFFQWVFYLFIFFPFARACLLFWWFDVCCSGRRGAVGGVSLAMQQRTVILMSSLSTSCAIRRPPAGQHGTRQATCMFPYIFSLHHSMVASLSETPNHTKPFNSCLLFCYTFVTLQRPGLDYGVDYGARGGCSDGNILCLKRNLVALKLWLKHCLYRDS